MTTEATTDAYTEIKNRFGAIFNDHESSLNGHKSHPLQEIRRKALQKLSLIPFPGGRRLCVEPHLELVQRVQERGDVARLSVRGHSFFPSGTAPVGRRVGSPGRGLSPGVSGFIHLLDLPIVQLQ